MCFTIMIIKCYLLLKKVQNQKIHKTSKKVSKNEYHWRSQGHPEHQNEEENKKKFEEN